jgi:hypothetical protein
MYMKQTPYASSSVDTYVDTIGAPSEMLSIDPLRTARWILNQDVSRFVT